jgi:5-formyltetrahydrofolate cyclo-ligase
MKSKLREIAKKKRSELIFDLNFYQKIEKNIKICLNDIFKLHTNFETASLYHPVHNEVSPKIFIKYFETKNITLSLPVVDTLSNSITFKEWFYKEELTKGPLGNMEPLKSKKNIFPQIMVVPLLMFDKSLLRLGYGGGFYDKSINKHKKYFKKKEKPFITIGLAHSSQEIDFLPHESHDMRLDFIVTEEELLSKNKNI